MGSNEDTGLTEKVVVIQTLTDSLERSNTNVSQLKDTLALVLERETQARNQFITLQARHNFTEKLLRGQAQHQLWWYQQRISQLETQLAAFNDTSSALATREHELNYQKTRLLEQTESVVTLQAQVREQEAAKIHAVSALARAQSELQFIKQEMTDMQAKFDRTVQWKDSEVQQLKTLLEEERRRNADLHEKMGESLMQRRSQSAAASSEDWRKQLIQAKEHSLRLDSEKQALEEKNWSLQRDLEHCTLKLSIAQDELQELKRDHEQHTGHQEQFLKKYEAVEAEFKRREAALRTSLSEKDRLLKEVEQAFEEHKAASLREVQALQAALSQLEEKHQVLGAKQRSLETKCSDMEVTNDGLKQTRQSLQDKVSALQHKLELQSAEHQHSLERHKTQSLSELERIKQEFSELSNHTSQQELLLWKSALLQIACMATQEPWTIEDQLRGILGVAPERLGNYDLKAKERVDSTVARIRSLLANQVSDPSDSRLRELLDQVTHQYRCEMAERKRLHMLLQTLRGNIRVMCRVRPLLPREAGSVECVQLLDVCKVKVLNTETRRESLFEFDRAFGPLDSQDVVYYEASDIVQSVMDGYNGCIMAFGQTGSGKTHTMEGSEHYLGIAYRALKEIFDLIDERKKTHAYSLSVTILEVYNETIRDLLRPSPHKIEVQEEVNGTTHIRGAWEQPVTSYDDIVEAIAASKKNRAVGCTNVNEYSSRSHCILTLFVQGHSQKRSHTAKLSLIDLAGSERVWKSGAEGQRMYEACNINQSLCTLGVVLSRLAAKEKHVPYRDSKLTHLLKDTLSSNAKTMLIINISPAPRDVQETVSSLSFGTRAARVEKGKAQRTSLSHTATVPMKLHLDAVH